MIWLKEKGLKNRHQHLCLYESIISRQYDRISLERLAQVLKKNTDRFNTSHPIIGSTTKHSVTELCAGQGRNISTIIKSLKPSRYIAIDLKQQAIQEIQERWREYTECDVEAVNQKVSQFINENQFLW